MKRFISILLSISMILSMSATALAANESNIENQIETYMENIEDGDMFIQQTEDRAVVILTNDIEHIINISFKYTNAPEEVYQWIFEDYPVSVFCPDDPSFWADIVHYAEGRMEEATIIEFSYSDQPVIRSSAGADLQQGMVDLLGKQYSDKLIQMKLIENHQYRVYETMKFLIDSYKTITWKDAITVASYIVSFIGCVVTSPVATVVCSVFGIVAGTATSLIPAGKTNLYSCRAQYTRYVTIDGNERKYAWAYNNIL